MRRLARLLLNAATALSLVLCAATLVLWVRSYWVKDWFQWVKWTAPTAGRATSAQRTRSAWSGRGVAGFIAAHYTDRPAQGLPWQFEWRPAPIGAWSRPGGSPLRSLDFGRQSVGDPAQGYHAGPLPGMPDRAPTACLTSAPRPHGAVRPPLGCPAVSGETPYSHRSPASGIKSGASMTKSVFHRNLPGWRFHQ